MALARPRFYAAGPPMQASGSAVLVLGTSHVAWEAAADRESTLSWQFVRRDYMVWKTHTLNRAMRKLGRFRTLTHSPLLTR